MTDFKMNNFLTLSLWQRIKAIKLTGSMNISQRADTASNFRIRLLGGQRGQHASVTEKDEYALQETRGSQEAMPTPA